MRWEFFLKRNGNTVRSNTYICINISRLVTVITVESHLNILIVNVGNTRDRMVSRITYMCKISGKRISGNMYKIPKIILKIPKTM